MEVTQSAQERHVEHLNGALSKLRAAQMQDFPSTWISRADRLRRLRSLVIDNREKIAIAINQDFSHRPKGETDLLEVLPSIGGIDHALKHGRKWMKPQRRKTGRWFKPARSVVLPQPLGVVGIIVPWNYPLFLAIGPLVSALVAGNRAMVKMADLTPTFSALFASLIQNYFDQSEIFVVNGDVEIARAFCCLDFDHLLFTGSTVVGREVMRAASSNLTPVTLELGGKSPAVIGAGANFEKAVNAIIRGKLFNAGQTCIAPDYVLLPKGEENRFIETARAVCGKLYPPSRKFEDYTSIITERHHERLHALIDDAVIAGATVHELSSGADMKLARMLPPVLLTGVTDDMAIMQEEIFGPILPVVSYSSLDDAIEYINIRPRPLALYMFERHREDIDHMIMRTVSGGVTINDTLLHIAQDDLPFGGVGDSGMGSYHGKEGFDTFSKLKPIVYQSWLNGMKLVEPPFAGRFAKMLRHMIR